LPDGEVFNGQKSGTSGGCVAKALARCGRRGKIDARSSPTTEVLQLDDDEEEDRA
jgi:hypothetical protein